MNLKPVDLKISADGNRLVDQVLEVVVLGGVVVVGLTVAQQLVFRRVARKASEVAAPVINTIVEAIKKPGGVADGAENAAKIIQDALKAPDVQKKVLPPVQTWLDPLVPAPAKPVKIVGDAIIDAMTPGTADNVVDAIDKPKKTGGSSVGKSIGEAVVVASEGVKNVARGASDVVSSVVKDPEVRKKVVPVVSSGFNPVLPAPAKAAKFVSDTVISAITRRW